MEGSAVEKSPVQNAITYFLTILWGGKEMVLDSMRSIRKSETGGKSSGKVCPSDARPVFACLTSKSRDVYVPHFFRDPATHARIAGL
jgi:hypothetical protein